MTTATHPASSPEFLSRLHDGELSAEERRDFETHSAECAECRESVAAYERSLTAFRAAPVSPVPYDLSARILRKIRAQSPSRRPFGVMFGIDIRWAGVFMAALLVAIMAPLFFESRRIRPSPASTESPEPLRAYVVDSPADERDAAAALPKSVLAPVEAPGAVEPKTRQRTEGRANERFAQAPAATDRLAAAGPPEIAAAPPPSEQAQAQPPAEGARDAAPPQTAAKRSAAAAEKERPAAAPETVGGEVGNLVKEEAPAQELHLDVRSLDADGHAPGILQTPAPERLLPLRGREFVLLVEADGSVRGVLPANREDEKQRLQKDKAASASDAEASDAVLFELRFRGTGQPRRVLVRVR